MRKKLLITVHGLNTTGAWQDTVTSALSRYFECAPLRYPGYHWFGFFRNCFSLWLFPMLATSTAVFLWWSHALGYVLGVAGITVAFGLAVRKRRQAVSKFLRDYEDAVTAHSDKFPHAVAHSFGTFLLSAGLRRHPDSVTFDRLVLFGSVVERKFPWDEMAARQAVRGVRNEKGYRDHVVRLASYAFWIRGMGGSGVHGFLHGDGLVDDVNYGEFNHSDASELRKHIQEVWLPFFWNLSVTEYRRLLSMCADCLQQCTPENPVGVVNGYPDFDRQIWPWAKINGSALPFRTFVETLIHGFVGNRQAYPAIDPRILQVGYSLACWVFWRGCSEQDAEPGAMAIAAARTAAQTIAGLC